MDQDTAVSKIVCSLKAVSEIFTEQKLSEYHCWCKRKVSLLSSTSIGHWIRHNNFEVLVLSEYQLFHLHNAIKATFPSVLL